VKPTSTCVEVSSADTTVLSHLRETMSSMISTAIPALVKCVVSKVHRLFGLYSSQAGNGRRTLRPGFGNGRKRLSARNNTRRTVDGDTHTRPR